MPHRPATATSPGRSPAARSAAGRQYSQHAYGLAVDLNPFQNPYRRGDVVLPELASAYLDRDWLRPGMITPDGASRARLRVDRLGVGRRLVEPEGLPALQPERPLRHGARSHPQG